MVNLVKTDEWYGRDLDSNRAVGEEAIKILDSIGMTTVDQAKVTLRLPTSFDSNHSYYKNFSYYFFIEHNGTKLYYDKVPQVITGIEGKDDSPWSNDTITFPTPLNDGQSLWIRFTGITTVGTVAATSDPFFLDDLMCTTEVSYRETPERTITANASLADVLSERGSPFTADPNTATASGAGAGQGAFFPEVPLPHNFPSYFDVSGLQVSDAGFNKAISSRRNLPIDIELITNTFLSPAILLGVRFSPPAPAGHLESVVDLFSVTPAGVRRDHARNVMVKESWDLYKYIYDHPELVYLEPSEKVYLTITRYGYDNQAKNYHQGRGDRFTGGDFEYSPENGWAPSVHCTIIEMPE